MSTLKNRDKVYCPSLGFKPFIAYTKKDINGIFIKDRGAEYWFTLDGVPTKTHQLPNSNYNGAKALWLGTEENRDLLSRLYKHTFKDSVHIDIYGINDVRHGSATDDWLFHCQEYKYDFMENIEPNLQSLKWNSVVLSPIPEELEKARNYARWFPNAKIICVAKDDINNWCNVIGVQVGKKYWHKITKDHVVVTSVDDKRITVEDTTNKTVLKWQASLFLEKFEPADQYYV